MAKITITGTPAPLLQGIVDEQEIRGVIYRLTDGPVAGCEWRYRVLHPARAGQPKTYDWSPWLFAPLASVHAMLAQWSDFLAANANLTPPSTLQ